MRHGTGARGLQRGGHSPGSAHMLCERMATAPGAAGVLFVNRAGEVLLRLRDDKPGLRFANHWDVIGGAIEPGETERLAALREVEEEIGLRLETLAPLGSYPGNVLVVMFVAALDTPLEAIRLMEGQRIQFFTRAAAEQLALVPWVRTMLQDIGQREQAWALTLRTLRD